MTFGLRPCLITLIIVYPIFLMAGIAFFRHVVKNKPHADPARNRSLAALRFMLFVVLLPLGALLSMAVLGWLDPLFHLVQRAGW